jgi:hypothetical protein
MSESPTPSEAINEIEDVYKSVTTVVYELTLQQANNEKYIEESKIKFKEMLDLIMALKKEVNVLRNEIVNIRNEMK